jgi:hypothetical protein
MDPVRLQVGLLVVKKCRPVLLRCLGLAVEARQQSNPNGGKDERRNSYFFRIARLNRSVSIS